MRCEDCGRIIKEGGKRSLPQHRRFMALVAAYFKHWPEWHDFQPDNSEHLRAWALIKAGHFDVANIQPETILRFESLHSQGSYSFVTARGNAIAIYWPKSIAFRKCQQREAVEVLGKAEEVLEAESRIKADELLREEASAA